VTNRMTYQWHNFTHKREYMRKNHHCLSHWPSLSRRHPVHSISPITQYTDKQYVTRTTTLQTRFPRTTILRMAKRDAPVLCTVRALRLCAGTPNLHAGGETRNVQVQRRPARGQGTAIAGHASGVRGDVDGSSRHPAHGRELVSMQR